MSKSVKAPPSAEPTIVIVQRNGEEFVYTLSEARGFAFRLLTAIAEVEGRDEFAQELTRAARLQV